MLILLPIFQQAMTGLWTIKTAICCTNIYDYIKAHSQDGISINLSKTFTIIIRKLCCSQNISHTRMSKLPTKCKLTVWLVGPPPQITTASTKNIHPEGRGSMFLQDTSLYLQSHIISKSTDGLSDYGEIDLAGGIHYRAVRDHAMCLTVLQLTTYFVWVCYVAYYFSSVTVSDWYK